MSGFELTQWTTRLSTCCDSHHRRPTYGTLQRCCAGGIEPFQDDHSESPDLGRRDALGKILAAKSRASPPSRKAGLLYSRFFNQI